MEKLTPVLRTAVLALVVLVLIPIVIHLWCGVLDISRGHLVSVGARVLLSSDAQGGQA